MTTPKPEMVREKVALRYSIIETIKKLLIERALQLLYDLPKS